MLFYYIHTYSSRAFPPPVRFMMRVGGSACPPPASPHSISLSLAAEGRSDHPCIQQLCAFLSSFWESVVFTLLGGDTKYSGVLILHTICARKGTPPLFFCLFAVLPAPFSPQQRSTAAYSLAHLAVNHFALYLLLTNHFAKSVINAGMGLFHSPANGSEKHSNIHCGRRESRSVNCREGRFTALYLFWWKVGRFDPCIIVRTNSLVDSQQALVR